MGPLHGLPYISTFILILVLIFFRMVSIPQSGFPTFRRCLPARCTHISIVSIPQSGFPTFRRMDAASLVHVYQVFQSLNRASLHFDAYRDRAHSMSV